MAMMRTCDNRHPAVRVQSGRNCPACARRSEIGRPSRQARGYDAAHDRARAALLRSLPARCGYGCGTVIETPAQLVAAHVIDGDPSAGWMPSCALCNQRAVVRS